MRVLGTLVLFVYLMCGSLVTTLIWTRELNIPSEITLLNGLLFAAAAFVGFGGYVIYRHDSARKPNELTLMGIMTGSVVVIYIALGALAIASFVVELVGSRHIAVIAIALLAAVLVGSLGLEGFLRHDTKWESPRS